MCYFKNCLLSVCSFSWRYNPLWLYFHSPVAGFSLLVVEVSWPHTTTRHSRLHSSGRVINPSQRPLPDNTQHSKQTNIHAPGGIRTHNLSRRAAEDLRLRPRGHWNRRYFKTYNTYTRVNFIQTPKFIRTSSHDSLYHAVPPAPITQYLVLAYVPYWEESSKVSRDNCAVRAHVSAYPVSGLDQ